MGQFHAFLHRQQCGLITCLSWKTKPAASDERVLHSFPSPAVVVALVELVLGDQLVQLWVAGLLRYAAGDPLLDPLQYHISVVTPGHGRTFYPQQDVVVRCSAGLVLLVEVVGHLPKYLSFQNDRVEEVVKLLREFARHRDGVLCAQPPRGIAATHIVHLPQVGGYVEAVVLCTAEGEKESGGPVLPHHAEYVTATQEPILVGATLVLKHSGQICLDFFLVLGHPVHKVLDRHRVPSCALEHVVHTTCQFPHLLLPEEKEDVLVFLAETPVLVHETRLHELTGSDVLATRVRLAALSGGEQCGETEHIHPGT